MCRTWFFDSRRLRPWLVVEDRCGNDDRMRHFELKKASSVVPKDTFSSPVCLIVLMIDAAATWKAQIRTYFAARWIYIHPSLAFTLYVTISVIVKESFSL